MCCVVLQRREVLLLLLPTVTVEQVLSTFGIRTSCLHDIICSSFGVYESLST
jgi:hypothetical protein